MISSISLIQELRAIHALYEIGINLPMRSHEKIKFKKLERLFPLKINYVNTKSEKVNLSIANDSIKINHANPSISIGNIEKSLLYPLEFILLLKSQWKIKKKYHFSFIGLMTEKREKVLSSYCKNKIPPLLKTTIKSSLKGREFPDKSFDQKYYRTMLNSNFILCPDGDFVWTYRFIEAIFCGAIPIVENDHEVYKGFIYYKFDDQIKLSNWNIEAIHYNFKLSIERFTFTSKEIQYLQKKFNANF